MISSQVPLNKQFLFLLIGAVVVFIVRKMNTKYLKKYTLQNKLTDDDYFNILSTPALGIGMKKAAVLAGLNNPNDFSPHNLRKTLEVWLMSLGIGDLPLTAHIGHDIKTAASHYVSPDIFSWEEKRRMREIIGDLYER